MAASFLGPQRFELIADREKFEKELNDVLHKLLTNVEAPPKEKHVRSSLIATWREKGCASFWKVLQTFPLFRSHIICWKACFLVHRTFRDGHPAVCKKSAQHMRYLGDLGKHWSHTVAGFAPLNMAYVKVLMTRISFIIKNPEIPSNLSFDEKPFHIPADIDHVFQLGVEIFDMQSALLHFYAAVMQNLDPSRGVTAFQIQCRLAPLIPAIQDSAALYDLIFKIMKALHAALPADTLGGHRDRFNRQYHALRKYFHEASKFKYLQSLVTIPTLNSEPPSFLLPNLVEYELAKQVQTLPVEEESSVLPEVGTLVTTDTSTERTDGAPPVASPDSRFEDAFGSFDGGFDFQQQRRDEKDALIEQLMREIVELKDKVRELEEQRDADAHLMGGLRERLARLEAELADYKEIAEQTCNENVLLKRQIEASATDKGAHAEMEARAKASDEKFSKLREVYQKLRSEHITLLRTSGDSQKATLEAKQAMETLSEEKKTLQETVGELQLQLQEVKDQVNDEAAQVSLLREELRKKDMQSIQLERAQQSLAEELEAKKDLASHSLIVAAVEEVEGVVRKVLEDLEDPMLSGTTCTPEYLLEKTKGSLDIIDTTTANFCLYNNDSSSISKALSSLSPLSHSLCEVMLQGVATSHMAPVEQSQEMVKASRAIGEQLLKLLEVLKQEKPGSGTIASAANEVQKAIRGLGRHAGELASAAETETEDKLGDLVEEEMAATASTVEAAAQRIQEMLRKSREDDTGVKLEVNGRILDSCTALMQAIKVLIHRAKDLQGEIVSEGMGNLSEANDFYKKNSRWSEGLISASKQVGWGASVLVEAADKVVLGSGKFEELVVASHDIAASTAQLVAASRVKARPKSEKLKTLKSSSRNVSEATGSVVASAQSGSELRRQSSEPKFDYTKLSLTQAKRLEMESQVKALELEKELELERTHLADLRKVHYHLAGASEGWDEEQTES